MCLSKNASDGSTWLDVWGTVKGKHSKALNIRWMGQTVDLVTFRRGEWENELLAMAGVMPIH